MNMKKMIGALTAKFAVALMAFGCITGAWAAATIDETPYSTLAEAVAAVPTDGTMTTITMTADEDSSSNVTIPEGVSITLDGGADPGYQVGTIVNNGTLRLKGYVIATKIVNNSTATQFGYDSYVTCDMENSEGATFTAGYGQAASHATITGNIVNRGTFTANQAYFDIIGNVVNHGTLTFTASGGSISSGVVNFGTFTFGKCNNNTTISGGIVNYGTLTVLEPSLKNHTKIINGGIGNYGHAEITTTTTKTTTINGTITVGAGAYLKITGPINAYTVSAPVEPTTTWQYGSVAENFRITEYDDTGVVVNYVAQSPYGRYETFKAAWDDVMAHNVGNSIELLADATLNEILSDSAFTCSGGLHLSLNGHTLTVNANGGFSFANDWTISSMASTAGKIVINGGNLADRFSVGENGKLTIVKGKVDAELGSETSLVDVLELVYASGYAITEDSTNIYVQRASDVPAVVHVDSISLDKTEMTLAIGETNTLTATISPANATEQFVVWSAGDINIASIETPIAAADIATIKVIGQSTGTAYISARPLDWGEENPENYVCCTVTVTRSSNFYQDANDENVLHIANLAGLVEFRNEVNAGNSFAGKTVVLDVDIDMSSIASWDPIGQDYETIQGGDKLERRFAGTFDGNNKTLSNLTINDNTHNEAGLFGVTGYGSTFKDLTLDSPTVNGRVGVGTLAGKLWASSVINCHVTGDITVTGYQCVGGLAGSDSYTDITGCSVIGDDKATSVITGNYVAGIEDGDNIGGLVGMNGPSDPAAQKADQATSNCSVGNLTLRGWRKVGGLSGQSYNRESVYDCSVGDIDIICLADTTFAAAKEETLAFGGMVGIFAVVSDDTKYRHAENSYLEGTVSNVTITCANDDVNAYAKMGIISGGQRGNTSFVEPTDTQFNVTVSGTNSTSGTKVSDNTDKIYSAYKPPVAQIGDEKYATLAEAIADAQGGDTILLLADATLDAAVTVSMSLTITLDGHSITGTITAGTGYELVTSDTAYVVRGAGYAGEVLPAGPDMSGDVINVTAANAQYTLDGAYGDINGKTINFTESIAAVLELCRATKYEGSGTSYKIGYNTDNLPLPWSEENIATIKAHNGMMTYYRTVSNIVFTANQGVTLQGFAFTNGYHETGKYDFAREITVNDSGFDDKYVNLTSLNNITFEDLTFNGNVTYSVDVYHRGLESTSVSGITFNGCSFANTSAAAIHMLNDENTAYIDNTVVSNCTFTSVHQGVYVNKPNGATIVDNYFYGTGHNAIAMQSDNNSASRAGGDITIIGNYATGVGDRVVRFNYVGADANITINNNVFLKTAAATASESDVIKGTDIASGATVDLEYTYWNGATTSDAIKGAFTPFLPTNTGINSGTWKVDVSDYVAPGYAATDNGDGTWTVAQAATPVAQIGQNTYPSLAAAIADVPTDGTATTITMIDDSAEAAVITIPATKNVVLDLNGKTVSYTTDAKSVYFLTNKGTLTVKDTSTNADGQILLTAQPDTGYSVECVTVYNLGGTLTLESGTIKNATGGGLAYAVNNSSNAWGAGDDKVSTFNMTGGKVSAPGGDAALRVYQNCAAHVAPVSKNYVNISGGTIVDTGIFVDTVLYTDSGIQEGFADSIDTQINISGGTVNGLIDLKIRHKNNTKLNISGGDFTNAKLWVRKKADEYKGDEPTEPMVSISGGKFAFVTGKAFGLAYDCGATSWTSYEKPYAVSGGVFNLEVPAFACAEGYIPVANTDTATSAAYQFTVGKLPVAQNVQTGEKYFTLAAALDAAQNGDTVKLLSDIALTSMVTIDKSVKIDGNDKTITVTKGDANNYAFYFIGETAAIDCEFKNATIVSTGYQVAIMGNCDYQSTLKVDNVDITCDGECIYANGFITVNATGCEFRHNGMYATGKDPVYYSAIIVGYSGTINLADCAIVSFGNGVSTFPSGGTVTMSNVDIDVTAVADSGNSGYAMWVRNEDYTSYPEYCSDSVIIFESGSVKGNFKVTDTYTGDDPKNRYDARTTVSGGIFSTDPSAYVADGYVVLANEDVVTKDAYPYMVALGNNVTFELGESAPTGAEKPSDGAYAVGTALPLPTYTSADTTFAGWKVAGAGDAIMVLPAGMTGDITLVATWTVAQTIEVITTNEQSTVAIKVTEDWIAANVTNKEDSAESPTVTDIQEALNETADNGLKVWENYVIGQDPSTAVAVGAEQGAEITAMPVSNTLSVQPVDTGFTVEYSLKQVDTNGTTVATIETKPTTDFDIDLSKVSSNAYYVMTATIKTDAGAMVSTVTSTNVIGVLKVESSVTTTAVAVPWASYDGTNDISVADIVRTANLTEGDSLKAYDPDSKTYKEWTLGADKTWQPSSTISTSGNESAGNADAYKVARGSAVWLTRADPSQPIYLVGGAASGTVETELEAAPSETKSSWNLVGNPKVESVDVKNLLGAKTGDQVIVPTAGAPKNYVFVEGKGWGYYKTVPYEIDGVKVGVQSVFTTDDTYVPAGAGFWYLNSSTSKDAKINW